MLSDLIKQLEGKSSIPKLKTRTEVGSKPVRQKQIKDRKTDDSSEPAGKQAVREAPSTPPDDPLAAVQNGWDGICARITEKHHSSGSVISCGYPVEYQDGVLILGFKYKNHLEIARDYRQILVEEVIALVGKVSLEFKISDLPENAIHRNHTEDDPALKLLEERLGAREID
ncbi:MAG: hypothetical protein HQ568_06095 [Calditrichaeota bacterium]|nr:hypothetical protein [Calditrichota bacterium]